MDVKTINPVLEAFADIIPQLGFQSVQKTKIVLQDANFDNSGVMVNIGVLGQLRGCIIISMRIESAKQFASKMMMGMPVLEFDSLAQSAISEMSNMICANACTKFSQAGVSGLDISPPTMLIGEGGHVKLSVPKVVGVSFLIDDIEVDVYVGLM